MLKLCIFRQLRGAILMIVLREFVNSQVDVLCCSTGKDVEVTDKGQGHVMSQVMYVANNNGRAFTRCNMVAGYIINHVNK